MKYFILLILFLSSSANATALDFLLNGVSKPVKVDTVTPANSQPYPFMYLDVGGVRTNLSTEATLQTVNTNILGVNTTLQGIDFATSAKQDAGNTSLASIDGKTPALVGGKVPVDVTFPATQPVSGTVTANQGGTWNINNISGTISLPTGAATEATLSILNGKLANDFGVSTGAVRVASQLGNATGAANFNKGATGAQTLRVSSNITRDGTELSYGTGTVDANTLRVTLPTDQAAVPTKAPVNTNGSQANTSLTATTASTATAPANAVGFIIQAPDGNTDTIRWRVGGTASTTAGMQLQPGRDSGYIPVAANVSVCATASGTNAFEIQWILSQ